MKRAAGSAGAPPRAASAALRPCGHPGCPVLVKRGKCEAHTPQDMLNKDKYRGRRAYDTRRWRDQVRPAKLEHDPICQLRTHCTGAQATEVDHVDGDEWNMDDSNLRSACRPCHSARTAKDQAFGRGGDRAATAQPPLFG